MAPRAATDPSRVSASCAALAASSCCGPADLGHVEVDADDSRRVSGDVGEDSLVGHEPVVCAVRVGQLEFLLHGPLRVIQQLAVGGVKARRQLGRPDVESGLADDLTLGVAGGHRIGLVLAYVAPRGIQAEDGHWDRLEELLEEVGPLGGGLLGLAQLRDVGDDVHPTHNLTGGVDLRCEGDAQPGAVALDDVGLHLPRLERAPSRAIGVVAVTKNLFAIVPDDVGEGATRKSHGGGVAAHDPAVAVEQGDRVAHGIECRRAIRRRLPRDVPRPRAGQ